MQAVEVTIAGQRLIALSQGGIETCFQLPDFDLLLDIGRCPPGAEKRGTLLLTHGHIDHAGGLPYYVSLRNLLGFKPPRVYCPKNSEPLLRGVLDAWQPLQADTDRLMLAGVSPGDRIELGGDRFAIVFRSPHRIEAVGYTLGRRNKKLLPELVGEPPAAIADRVARGERVSEAHERYELCFPGDTNIDVLDSDPTVTRARVLLLECTFAGEQETPAKAKKGGHVHLDDVAARAESFANEALVLTHLSRRYAREYLEREIKAKLPAGLLARTWLLTHPPEGSGLLAPVEPAGAR